MPHTEFLSYQAAKALFSRYQIKTQPAHLVSDPQEAGEAYLALNAPVALKIISSAESHKSDKGLLTLALNDMQSVKNEAKTLFSRAKNIPVEGLLVQKMAPKGIEILLGLIHDAHFGMMLIFGAGGTLVEWLDDVTLRKTPISTAEARWLIQRHPIHRLLQGYRGQPPADIPSLARLMHQLSEMGTALAGQLDSLDINPVIVTEDGTHLVDFRISMKGNAHGA